MSKKKTNKKKEGVNFIVSLHVYPFNVMFSFGEDDDALEKKLADHGVDSNTDPNEIWRYPAPTVKARTIRFNGNQTLIRMRNLPKDPVTKGRLSHEIFHVVTFLMELMQMPLDLNTNDEAYAYLIGYLTEQVYKELKIK